MSHFVDTLLALATLALSFAEPAIFQQPGTGPGTGNYDSVQTNYDVVGRVSKVYQPYSAAAGAICSGTCPGTVAAYDALVSLSDGSKHFFSNVQAGCTIFLNTGGTQPSPTDNVN